jgi:hypothetical protein
LWRPGNHHDRRNDLPFQSHAGARDCGRVSRSGIASGRLATLDATWSGSFDLGAPLQYGRFLPAPWTEARYARYALTAGYQAPGASDWVFVVTQIGRRDVIPVASPTVAPAISPVRSLTINAANGLRDQTSPLAEPVVFAWIPPALGKPTAYELEIFAVEPTANGSQISTSIRLVLRYLTGSTAATLPPGALPPGGPYFARVSAIAGAVPYLVAPLRHSPAEARATTLTGTFSKL